jgi:hypothetical protein|tara:strand:+ start:64 stop:270 length:207 start_codon:yes stop_codon:yes gene_type:complete
MNDFSNLDDQLIAIRSNEIIDLLKYRISSGKRLDTELMLKIIEVGNLCGIIQQEQDRKYGSKDNDSSN